MPPSLIGAPKGPSARVASLSAKTAFAPPCMDDGRPSIVPRSLGAASPRILEGVRSCSASTATRVCSAGSSACLSSAALCLLSAAIYLPCSARILPSSSATTLTATIVLSCSALTSAASCPCRFPVLPSRFWPPSSIWAAFRTEQRASVTCEVYLSTSASRASSSIPA